MSEQFILKKSLNHWLYKVVSCMNILKLAFIIPDLLKKWGTFSRETVGCHFKRTRENIRALFYEVALDKVITLYGRSICRLVQFFFMTFRFPPKFQQIML